MAIKKPLIIAAGQVEQLAAADSVIGAGGGVRFQYDSNTTIADPGSGKFRFNIPPATQIAVSETDADGNNVASFLAALDDSSNAVHARLYIVNERTNSLFIYNVTGSVTDNGTWDTLNVGEILAGSLTNGDYVRMWAAYTGSDGATGASGSNGTNGRDAGLKYTYDTTTTDADPGSGKFRFNNATPSSATQLYISETDGDSNAISALIQSWDDADNSIRGFLTFVKDGSPSNVLIFQVTGSITDGGAYDKVTIANVVSSGSFSNNDVFKVSFSRNGDSSPLLIPGARLTLESHVPVSTSDQSAATTIYYTAWRHGGVPLYDGTRWSVYYLPGGQISAAVPSATSSAKPFDVFVYLDSGTPALEFIEWSSITARATNIINTSSPYLYTKTGDPSRLYVGTIHCTTGGQTNDTERSRHVWNMFNRVRRHMFWQGPNTTWTYGAGSTRFVNAVSNPHMSIVVGLAEELFEGSVHITARKSVGTTTTAVEIGITRGSTPNTFDTLAQAGVIRSSTTTDLDDRTLICKKLETPPQGFQEYNWCERTGSASATIALTGTNANEGGMFGSFTC